MRADGGTGRDAIQPAARRRSGRYEYARLIHGCSTAPGGHVTRTGGAAPSRWDARAGRPDSMTPVPERSGARGAG